MSVPSFLEKLLDGDRVEWVPLNALCGLITTGKLNANAMEADGIYPFFTCNEKPYKINSYAFDLEAIIISGNGSQVGHLNYYQGKFNAYQRTYVVGDFKDAFQVMYLYHYLNYTLKTYITQNSRKGSVPYITMPMLQNFQIPIPCPENREKSLAIQAEIVRILDTFTELTHELTTELIARQKQYRYYREKLLIKKYPSSKESTLGDILNMRAGKHIEAKDIVNTQTTEQKYICYGGNGSRGFVSSFSHDGNHVLIGRQGALCGNVKRAKGQFYATEHAVVCTPKKSVDIDWVFHMLTFMDLNKYKSKSAQPGLAVSKIAQLPIVVPPLEEQARIVAILDKFDALTNSISEGLPREIELRQKQYEYYRDLLLNFPKP